MPLPKALKRGAPKAKKKKVVAETMHDLKNGPHHKDRTHKQEVAIAMKQSGQSRKGRAKKIIDPSGDDKMVKGKMVDPSGDNRFAKMKKKKGKKK